MGPLVNFQILRPGEHLPAGGERTGERLFAGMHANMIDQLVFCLKGAPIASAFAPKTHVVLAFRAPNMFHRQMGNDFVHAAENPSTGFLRTQWVLIYPHAGHRFIPVIKIFIRTLRFT